MKARINLILCAGMFGMVFVWLQAGCSDNGGSCTNGCELNQNTCQGNQTLSCQDANQDGCPEWVQGEVCDKGCDSSTGKCIGDCDSCERDKQRCSGVTGFQLCSDEDNDGCAEWGDTQKCPEGQSCGKDGKCFADCYQCKTETKGCSADNKESWVCTRDGATGCLKKKPIPCAGEKACDPKKGICTCVNKCNEVGDTQCNERVLEECYKGEDGCLTWKTKQDCSTSQQSCNVAQGEAQCVATCEDECPTEGDTQCGLLVLTVQECRKLGDNCLHWVNKEWCVLSFSICSDSGSGAKCGGDCSDACTASDKGCTNALTRWECADNNGDECLEKVEINCLPSENCTDGVCEAAQQCTDDDLEENDSLSGAMDTFGGVMTGLKLCPNDEDWYKVETTEPEVDITGVVADLKYVAQFGDINVEIQDDQGAVLASGTSTGDTESIRADISPNLPRFIRIFGKDASTTNQYDMEIWFENVAACTDDEYEDNDDKSDPTPANTDTFDNLVICPGDEDWFVFASSGDENVLLTLMYTAADGNIDAEIVDLSGDVLAAGHSTGDFEEVEAYLYSEGNYLIHVFGAEHSVQNSYSMQISLQ